jgi:AcrR family transcriptional regulator
MNIRFPADASPRDRMLLAAKHLMSALGYENTTSEAICREARTTEAQLIKYFGTKEALLEAIFEQGWGRLRMQMTRLQTVQSPHKKIKLLIHFILQLFNQDRPLRDLMLLEGRRIRRESKMVMLTAGYTELVAFLDGLIEGELKHKTSPHHVQLVRSSLIGLCEGLLRDLVLHERFGFPAEFTIDEIEKFLAEMVDRLLHPLQR